LARRRPWIVARETASLDRLSGGRLIFGAGLGHRPEEIEAFSEEPSPKVRASMLDEALEIIVGLWSGKRFAYEGDHYKIGDAIFLPTPVQVPRIPIWIGGRWPHRAPFRRAAMWDGVFPLPVVGSDLNPNDLRQIQGFVSEHRTRGQPFDLIHLGISSPDEHRPDLFEYGRNGMTWWLEDIHPRRFGDEMPEGGPVQAMRKRVLAGPPKVQS
jgi:alkanesulfonate monooxygenase SsuD/methylene tetrahydromethanopterin reductase-like flavin-dependent oxidoreductase (luciferase family)